MIVDISKSALKVAIAMLLIIISFTAPMLLIHFIGNELVGFIVVILIIWVIGTILHYSEKVKRNNKRI